MNPNALIIIAKYPEKGKVKTRLAGHLTDEYILKLYISLLEKTVSELKDIPGTDTFIAFAPAEAEHYFNRFDVRLIPLPEGDLGERMYHAFRDIFNAGYQKAALVGADIPDLTAGTIRSAFDRLTDSDTVFGPAKDGGYYLVGMRKLIRAIFENVPWSSHQTLKKSMEQAERSGHSTSLIKMLSDIDTIDDAKRAGFMSKIKGHIP